MMSPIEQAIELHGEDLHLLTAAIGGSRGYSPKADFAPPPEAPFVTFRGAWQNAYIQGVVGQRDECFLVGPDTDVTVYVEGKTEVRRPRTGKVYTIAKVRSREHSGETAGYECWVTR